MRVDVSLGIAVEHPRVLVGKSGFSPTPASIRQSWPSFRKCRTESGVIATRASAEPTPFAVPTFMVKSKF
jgi:hypothetical protein